MLIQCHDRIAEIDVERTKAAYADMPVVSCTCAYCRNFLAAYEHAPQPIKNLIHALGADLSRVAEVAEYGGMPDEPLHYIAMVHFVGALMEPKEIPPNEVIDIQPVFGVPPSAASLDPFVAMVDEKFPWPVVQMSIVMYLPWVLPEPRPMAISV